MWPNDTGGSVREDRVSLGPNHTKLAAAKTESLWKGLWTESHPWQVLNDTEP